MYKLASEEDPEEIMVEETGNYSVAFDPLDGSSNIECNVSIGTIFGIFRKTFAAKDLVAAGYCVYGPSTQLVLAIGHSFLNLYTLDSTIGEFLLSQSDIKIPENPMIYSINEGNAKKWVDEGVWHYVEMKKEEGASLRYVGSMVKP